MSVGLDVIPTSAVLPTWQKLITRWKDNCFQPEVSVHLQELKVEELFSHVFVNFDEALNLDKIYGFHMDISTRMALHVCLNWDNLTEEEFLQNYAPNLNAQERQEFALRWKPAGHFFTIESYSGGDITVPELMIALASALAEIVAGYVILTGESSNPFDHARGIYSPDIFRRVRWIEGREGFVSIAK